MHTEPKGLGGDGCRNSVDIKICENENKRKVCQCKYVQYDVGILNDDVWVWALHKR